MTATPEGGRAQSFGDDAAQYDRTRPTYPDALVTDLVGGRPLRVLDVGCGTGIATRLFAEKGADVLGVEADARMAEVGRRAGLAIEVSTFEDWVPQGEPFDLVISAQAWHWVDPVIGPRRAAEALRPGGRLALFWNGYQHQPAVAAVFAETYGRLAPNLLAASVALGTAPHRFATGGSDPTANAIDASGWFAPATEQAYPWQRSYTVAAWLDELPSHSDHRLLPAAERDALLLALGQGLDSLGQPIVVDFTTRVVTAIRL